MKLRIKNFRSFKDTGDVEIKPITLLVGKNSSGKSSFLRTFPMLKQSTMINAVTPISLNGDYVDFGSLENIKPKFNIDRSNEYELKVDLTGKEINRIFNNNSNLFKEDISLNLKYMTNNKDYLDTSSIIFNTLEYTIKITFNNNKKTIENIIVNNTSIIDSNDSIPFTYSNKLLGFELIKVNTDLTSKGLEISLDISILENFSKRKITSILEKHHFNNEDINRIGSQLKQISLKNFFKDFKRISNVDWDNNSPDFLTLKDLVISLQFTQYILLLNIYMDILFRSIKYIGPTRVSKRDYRIQNLATDEVYLDGGNLPDFINSLDDEQKKDFQTWTEDNFGFKVDVTKTNGYQSIVLKNGNDYINIIDVGFGYSQILPILTQIWFTLTYDNKKIIGSPLKSERVTKIITIEQPELHLHPEFQAKFADAIVNVVKDAKERDVDIRLVIETHSDIIISRLGESIISDEIDKNDINIVIFDKKDHFSETKVSFAKFDQDGDLENWPIGFFNPPIKS